MVSDICDKKCHGSLSVSVDLSNPEEVEILKEVLLMWSDEMKELEILFKVHSFHSYILLLYIVITLISHRYFSFRTTMLLPKKENVLSNVKHMKHCGRIKNHSLTLTFEFILCACITSTVRIKKNLC